jgi:predicted nucleic acid-binding protein
LKYLLDNDTFNHILRNHPVVTKKLRNTEAGSVALSAVAALESLRGSLAIISQTEAKGFKPTKVFSSGVAYNDFVTIITAISQFAILPFDDASDVTFRSWPENVKRIGPNDCRIAASAIVHGLIVVTCNTSHFEQIADRAKLSTLHWEDWSLPADLEKP